MTEQCVKDTFEGAKNYNTNDNKVLREFSKMWKQYGTGYTPSVVINKRTFRGDMNPDNVFQAICAGFHTMPKACIQSGEQVLTTGDRGITANGLIVVVVLLVLVNLCLIVIYRKCSNKELQEDMQLQVNSAVSQYFALSTRNTSGNQAR